ncbi:MAG: serine/threonine protein kinase, partial [Acidobacteria bacterium]|nr:serine/threonine protein kinase [Acidobacteriota bacterium]
MSPPSSRYRILDSLGKGGMGEVFLADDTQLGRKVAIKFVTEALESDPTPRERLHREARSAAALDHPYICKIYEIAEVDARTGIVMEYVSGEALQASLARGPVSPQRALEIASEIAEALDEAHTHRLVHRDLEPANVMLTGQGHVKVMDFGLAKAIESASGPLDNAETVGPITESGVRVGTPGYMAPEQLLGGQTDTRSDIFAFGILLYEMLAGVQPFHRTSQSGTMAAILRDPPPPVTQYQGALPESARTALDRLLAKEPDRRHQSFAEVRTDLKRLSGDLSVITPLAPPAP